METARFRALLVLPVTAGVLLLSGCGDPTAEPGSGGATTVAPSTAPSDLPSAPAKSVKPGPPAQSGIPTESGRPVTIEGVIEEGVEPGCRVLTAGSSSYLILGGGADVPTGVPVRVEGVLAPGVLSTCQQGTPLRVTKVQRR